MRGYKLTNQQSINMLMDEIDKALTLPNNFDEIITPFINKMWIYKIINIQNGKIISPYKGTWIFEYYDE